jgi:hypothetical protein
MRKTTLFLSILFLFSIYSCGPSAKEEEKEKQQNDSIAKVEKQRIIDSVKEAENIKNQETKDQQTTHNQKQEQKQNMHIDKSGAIRIGQPKN